MGGRTLPSGVVTFMLTDVVGSTQLWSDSPEAMETALAEHDEIIARAVESHDGTVLKARGEGDSTFSVFARASDGVRAAHSAQVALSTHEWRSGLSPSVRIAVHSGEAAEKDGDYLGTTVNRAARLRGITEGGEVIVSAATSQLVADHLPFDTSLQPLGSVRLRSLDRPEDAFVLVGPGLRPPGQGARGEVIADALTEAGITKREREVLDAVGERLTNLEIATRLSVSERTVESHVSSLLRKLGVTTRLELVAVAKDAARLTHLELPAMLLMSAQRSACVGRRDQRERLAECWERASSGQTALVVIKGEAGIGKTRLTAELAMDVQRRGGRVLLGAANDGAQMPHQPIVDALSDIVANASESQLRTDLGSRYDALVRTFPQLAGRRRSDASERAEPLTERAERDAAIATLVSNAARRHPTMLVLEDMHWATSVTRDAALEIVRRGGTAPLLVVLTTRDTAPELDSALTSWLAAADRLAEVVSLGGLDLAATTELLADVEGAPDPADALRDTGGNPLLLREIASGGAGSPTLRDLLANRYALLSQADLDMVDTAAVLGESFRADVVAAARGVPVEDVIETVERATHAGIVDVLAQQPGRFAFVHALFRDARYGELPAGRRIRLHADVTRALLSAADDPEVLPALARHACIAAPLGDASIAVDLAQRAGTESQHAGDYAEAAKHFERALDVIDLMPQADERLRLELMIRLGEATVPLDRDAAAEVLRDAARLARRIGDAVGFADAVCSMVAEDLSFTPGREDPMFVGLCEEALSLLPETELAWRARTLACLGAQITLGAEPERGVQLSREAIQVARQSGDAGVLVSAVLSHQHGLGVFDLDEREASLLEVLPIARRLGMTARLQNVCTRLSSVARTRGDIEAMRRWHTAALDCTAHRNLTVLQIDATAALVDGDLHLAAERNWRTRELASNYHVARLYFGVTIAVIDLWRAKTHTGDLRPLTTRGSFVGRSAAALLAFSCVLDGDVGSARDLLASARAMGFDGVRWAQSSGSALGWWAEVAYATGDREGAQMLLDLLDPIAGYLADGGGVMWCSVDFARSLLMVTLGDLDAAEATLETAAAASRARGTPLLLARELMLLAWVRAQQRDIDVGPLVDEAVAIADERGAALIRWDAERYGLVRQSAL